MFLHLYYHLWSFLKDKLFYTSLYIICSQFQVYCFCLCYLKKLGLINANIALIAPNNANPIATFLIISCPFFGSPIAHCIPPMITIITPTTSIITISIFDNAFMTVGKTESAASSEPSPHDFSKQLPINGKLVFSGIQIVHHLPSTPYLQLHT